MCNIKISRINPQCFLLPVVEMKLAVIWVNPKVERNPKRQQGQIARLYTYLPDEHDAQS